MYRIFIPLVILVYSSLCLYSGIRISGLIRYVLPGMRHIYFWAPYAVLCYGMVFTGFIRLGQLRFPHQLGVYWMAIFVYLLLTFVAFDIVRFIVWICDKNIVTPRFNAIGTGAAMILCVLIICFGALNSRSIRTVKYSLNIPGHGEDIRIALISDMHIGTTVNSAWIMRIAETVNRTEPDMVCIAGDIFDNNIDNIT